MAAIDHPYICKIFEIGEDGDALFLVMEYIAGETLHRRLQDGALPLSDALRVAGEIAEALQKAHARRFLHRDLKPANIMLTEQGHVKVMDFGLAKRVEDLPSPDQATCEIEGPTDGPRGHRRHTGLHVARAGKGRHTRCAFRLVFLRRDSGRDDRRRASVPPAIDWGDARCGAARTAPSERRHAARSHGPRAPSAGQDPWGSLRVGRRRARRSGPAGLVVVRSHRLRRPLPTVRPPCGSGWHGRAGARSRARGVLVVTSGLLRPTSPAPGAATAIRSIAVLPLDNYSGDPNQDYFAEGMTDELTANLATISQLRVISRGSAMQFKGKDRPPTPDIAEKLNVDAVVEGSVSRSGDKVRITAQLIDARADKHLWANTFERSSRDVLALQAELASAIAREVNVRLTSSEQLRLAAVPSVNPEAHDAYLKGRYFFNRPSDENLQKAIAQFEEAVRLSPTFAPAFSGLSDAYLWAGYNEGFLTATEARPKARAAAEKAVTLDDNSAEAHTSLARVQAVLRIRPGWVRARIPACVCAQPQLRVRARSVRHGAGVPRTVPRGDRRGRTRDRTGSAVAPDAGRCVRCVHVPTELGGGQGTRHGGQRNSIRHTSSPS